MEKKCRNMIFSDDTRMRNLITGVMAFQGRELGYGVLAGVGAFAASLALYKGMQYIRNRDKVVNRQWPFTRTFLDKSALRTCLLVQELLGQRRIYAQVLWNSSLRTS